MIENLSGLEPLGRAVLVRMVELEEWKAVRIVIPEHVKASSATVEQRAEVVAVGSAAWEDEKQARAQPGDKVIITKFAGYVTVGADGQIYRLVNDRDIFCRVNGVVKTAARTMNREGLDTGAEHERAS